MSLPPLCDCCMPSQNCRPQHAMETKMSSQHSIFHQNAPLGPYALLCKPLTHQRKFPSSKRLSQLHESLKTSPTPAENISRAKKKISEHALLSHVSRQSKTYVLPDTEAKSVGDSPRSKSRNRQLLICQTGRHNLTVCKQAPPVMKTVVTQR